MPFLREYEYNRILLQALYYIASRQEVKILEFYGRKGAPPLPQAMKEAFQLGSLSLEKFEEEWVRTSWSDSFCAVTKPKAKAQFPF